ncbi:lytic transglycosylase domain-containing protein [Geoalkalibacter sp.]|uniref:lytic transglycosylase domain-containing protein n=1 Tax=Geoalkalibacter sp. TaxID=3041440 RepID=UPI00272EE3BA|nr:lytic transglycosylase domain-containing protein [Geoalkalibacter sp.]
MARAIVTLWLMGFWVPAVLAQDYCFEQAAAEYQVPAHWLWAIAKVESAFDPAATNTNTNGSVDFGVMQINSWWVKKIGEQGWAQLGDPCTNIRMGAYVLADCLKRFGRNWQGIGCYNAVTPSKQLVYAKKVIPIILALESSHALGKP